MQRQSDPAGQLVQAVMMVGRLPVAVHDGPNCSRWRALCQGRREPRGAGIGTIVSPAYWMGSSGHSQRGHKACPSSCSSARLSFPPSSRTRHTDRAEMLSRSSSEIGSRSIPSPAILRCLSRHDTPFIPQLSYRCRGWARVRQRGLPKQVGLTIISARPGKCRNWQTSVT